MRSSGDSAVLARAPCIAALDMGYGHLRAAASLAAGCGASVVHADRPPVATEAEQRAWRRARSLYEGLSRAADAWYAPGARRFLDLVTGIAPTDSGRDLSRPNLPARQLDRLIREGLGTGLAARLKESGDALVSTFYSPAIAADAHGAERVHLVITDSDVNRVWAPADARRSRITYFAPAESAVRRLVSYGVAEDRIRLTGFPLPPELTGRDDGVARAALSARISRLDPRGTFRDAHRDELIARLGAVPDGPAGPLTIVFAVGGAGAQSSLARLLLSRLREPLSEGSMRLVLVAGTRPHVAANFERWVAATDVGDAVRILFEPAFDAYYARFNEALAAADLLWTKPSELTFYGALGLPLALAPPLGVHERRNRAWAVGLGAALDAEDGRRAAQRLPSLVADGSLAAMAWAGWNGMPRAGTWRVLDAVQGRS